MRRSPDSIGSDSRMERFQASKYLSDSEDERTCKDKAAQKSNYSKYVNVESYIFHLQPVLPCSDNIELCQFQEFGNMVI